MISFASYLHKVGSLKGFCRRLSVKVTKNNIDRCPRKISQKIRKFYDNLKWVSNLDYDSLNFMYK